MGGLANTATGDDGSVVVMIGISILNALRFRRYTATGRTPDTLRCSWPDNPMVILVVRGNPSAYTGKPCPDES